jgi:hypothetical protein
MTSREPSTKSVSAEALQQASDEFDRWCQERHERGAEEYGAFNFFKVDTVQMAMEEVADLANYARYTFIKLYVLQHALNDNMGPATTSTGTMPEGKFVPTKENWG